MLPFAMLIWRKAQGFAIPPEGVDIAILTRVLISLAVVEAARKAPKPKKGKGLTAFMFGLRTDGKRRWKETIEV